MCAGGGGAEEAVVPLVFPMVGFARWGLLAEGARGLSKGNAGAGRGRGQPRCRWSPLCPLWSHAWGLPWGRSLCHLVTGWPQTLVV